MNCKFCGTESPTGVGFCVNCGSKLGDQSPEVKAKVPEESVQPISPQSFQPPPKKKMGVLAKVLIGFGSVAGLLLVIAMGSSFSKGVADGFEERVQEDIAATPLTFDEFTAATSFTQITKAQCKPLIATAKNTKAVALAKKRLKSLNKADGNAWAAYDYVGGHDWVNTPDDALDTWSSEWSSQISALYDTIGASAADTEKIAVSKDSLYSEFETKVKDDCGLETSYSNTETTLTTVSTKAAEVKALADTRPWYPKGYKEWEDGLAWKWVDAYDDCYSCSYWHIKVVTRDGCAGGIYAEINIERGGSVVDWTNDTVPYLDAGYSALLAFETYTEGSLTGSLTTLTCHAY